jgi:hypothetical protein
MWPSRLYIPGNVSEIVDHLGMMMISSPTFTDKTGRFPYRNVDVVFHQLNEGLRLIRGKLNDERYLKLIEMSGRMRTHFDADPENKTEDTLKGRSIIAEMQGLLKQGVRRS